MIRLLIADDHPVVRTGVRLLLRDAGDMRVAAEAGSAAEALTEAARKEFDAIILDLTFPDGSGLDLLQHLSSKAPVVMFTNDIEAAGRCMNAGAAAFVSKQAGSDELMLAVREAVAGRKFVSPNAARYLDVDCAAATEAEKPPHFELSPRELEVMLKFSRGKRSKEIAFELGIDQRTVGTYRTRLMKKLQVSDTRGLVLYALRAGLTDWF